MQKGEEIGRAKDSAGWMLFHFQMEELIPSVVCFQGFTMASKCFNISTSTFRKLNDTKKRCGPPTSVCMRLVFQTHPFISYFTFY